VLAEPGVVQVVVEECAYKVEALLCLCVWIYGGGCCCDCCGGLCCIGLIFGGGLCCSNNRSLSRLVSSIDFGLSSLA